MQCGDLSKHIEERNEINAAGETVRKLKKEIQGREMLLESKQKLKVN